MLVSTLCQVLSEIEKVSAPTKQMETILLFRDKAELPPWPWLHDYISLSEPSLSTTCHAKQLSGRKSDTAAVFTFAPYFSCPKTQMQGWLVPWKTKRLPLINRMLGFLWSHTHTHTPLFSLWLDKHPQLPTDPFTHCALLLWPFSWLGCRGSSQVVARLAHVVSRVRSPLLILFTELRQTSVKTNSQSIHKHCKEILTFSFQQSKYWEVSWQNKRSAGILVYRITYIYLLLTYLPWITCVGDASIHSCLSFRI